MINPNIKVEDINKMGENTCVSAMGIVCTEIGPYYLCGKMPVDHRTVQPFGILHGGASVVLAETLGSYASYCCIDSKRQICVGLEINANHVRGVKSGEGYVYGKAEAVHIGKKTHIWGIRITNEKGDLVCISRITIAVLDKEKA